MRAIIVQGGTFPLAAARMTLYINETKRSAGVAQG
jgi:hypothetical protein